VTFEGEGNRKRRRSLRRGEESGRSVGRKRFGKGPEQKLGKSGTGERIRKGQRRRRKREELKSRFLF
jgi:hypothetical protein